METIIASEEIKAEALSLGFDVCGLAVAEPVDTSVTCYLKRWLDKGNQAEMTYLCNHFEKRCNPLTLVDGAQTVISVALNYYPSRFIPSTEYQIAWYAYGKDYHEIVKNKLLLLLEQLQKHYPTLAGRAFCDTAPILERYWAWKAGLGWIGKNTLLIIPHFGSCLFLGELIINLKSDKYGTPLPERCGDCSLCLDNCPTKALEAQYELNANRCINYITIENKGEISPQMASSLHNTIYGCNKCQEVCPWNRHAKGNTMPELQPNENLLGMRRADWETLTEEQYKQLFSKSAIKRAKYQGLMRNIRAVRYHRK